MPILNSYLKPIADAIRNKKGTTEPINAQNFADEINSIQTGVKISAFGYAGTPIPTVTDTYLDKVYINKELSINEVVSILDTLTLKEVSGKKQINVITSSLKGGFDYLRSLTIYKDETYGYYIEYKYVDGAFNSNPTNTITIFSQYEKDGMIGWKEDFSNEIICHGYIITPNYGVAPCYETDKLSSLFSTSPFTYSEELDRTITLNGSYVGNVLSVSENKTIDMEDMLEQNILPLRIDVNVPGIIPEGTLDITENGEKDVTNYAKVNVNVQLSGEGTDMLQARVDATNSCNYLFYNYSGTNVDYISGLDTSKVTTMYYMFYNCSNLTITPLLNTSNVTDMSYMFYKNGKLTTIPQFNTSKVTTMKHMFNECKELSNIPQLNTSSVTDMSNMFYQCNGLTSIPQFNTSKVTTMSYMFYYCNKLTSIPQLDTSSVTDMSYMFYQCNKLTSIPQLDTSKVTTMSNMFYQCNGLTSIPQLDTSKVTTLESAFMNCYNLTLLDLSNFNTSSTWYSNYMCMSCYSLKALVIRSFGTSYTLNTNSFNNCYHILGSAHAVYNPTGAKDGYIYVPRNMVETLQSATNWSKNASQFRALEDYTLDGTTTGELNLTAMGIEV